MTEERIEYTAPTGGMGIQGLLLFGLCGALFWGMRGAPGYGGITGAVIPGLVWGLVWYRLSRNAGVTPPAWIVLACTLGFGLGGFNGYGQYISWISGIFHIEYPDSSIAIPQWKGFLYLFITGAGWGGLGGVFLSWIYAGRVNWLIRTLRASVLPAGFIAGRAVAVRHPEIFMPFFNEIDYNSCTDCARTYATTIGMVSFISMSAAATLFEILRLNLKSIRIIATAALGFGTAFAGSAPFHLLRETWPVFDWWKAWEMSVGFVGGATVWLIFRMCVTYRHSQEDDHCPHENPTNKTLLVDLPAFIVTCWAFFGCIGVHMVKSFALQLAILFTFIPFAAYIILRQRPEKEYAKALADGGAIPRDRLVFPLVALSVMSLIVIWPNYSIAAVFLALASLSLFIHLLIKRTEV